MAVEVDLGTCPSTVQAPALYSTMLCCAQNTAPRFRLITDLRPTNVTVDAWYVKNISIKGLSLVLTRCAIWWERDFMNVYHNAV